MKSEPFHKLISASTILTLLLTLSIFVLQYSEKGVDFGIDFSLIRDESIFVQPIKTAHKNVEFLSESIPVRPVSAATTITITDIEDNSLDQGASTTTSTPPGDNEWNQGGQSALAVGLANGPLKNRRSLIKFNLSSIPVGATITNAELQLTCIYKWNSNADNVVNSYRLLRPWVEGTSPDGSWTRQVASSWWHTNYPEQWGQPGASQIGVDRNGSSMGSATITSACANTTYSWNLDVATVTDWVNDPATNYGMVLIGNESTQDITRQFASSENATVANRPKLFITYTTGGAGGDTVPPVISNGAPTGTLAAGTTSATISVTTDEAATCKASTTPGVSYNSMPLTFANTGGVNHSDTLNNLTNGSTYNYYIRCQDVANNINTSDYTLTFSVAAGVSSSVCGNGIVESGEQCDGSNLNGASCTSQGYSGGALSCSSSSCQFVTTSCTSASGGVTYHVRTDGSDTTCNGKSNTSASAAPNCAFRNPQKAADSIAPGDDIIIHPGTYSAFTIRGTNSGGTFQATAANPTIIEGESGVARDQITITGGVAKAAFYSGGGAGSSSRTRYLTIRHLHLTAGTEAALMLDGEHSDFVIKDIVIDDVDSLGVSPTGESGCRGTSLPCYGGRHDPTQRDAALYVNYAGGPIYQGNGLLEDIKIVGTPQYCATTQGNGGTICGVDANAISLAASFTNVRRVEAEYFLGNFLIRAPSDGIVEYNMVKNFGCDSDDGCIQLYNVSNSTIRYNVFSNATPINEALAVIRTRRTSSSTSQPSAKIYNNTFIGYTTGFTASHRKKAVEIAPPGTVGALTGSIVIKNNIFMNNYGSTTSNAGAVSITDCPTSLDVDNNLYFNNNKNFVNVAGCSGTFEANAQYANPQLDLTTFAPNMGSPACSGGDSSVDSNQGGDFIGALGCSSTPPARSNGLPSGTLPYTTTQTIMSLVTDKNATCKYGTTANTSYTALPNTFTTTGASTHSTQLSTLTLGTSYTYYVRCRDAQRNTNTNDFTISFSVASTPVGAPGGTPPGSTPGGGGTPPANSTTGTGAGTQTTPTTSPANGNNSTLGNISLTSAQIQATLDAAKQRLRRIDSALVNRLLGRILLEVEEHGEAWYLDPVAKLRYYLANGPEAYQALRQFGLGITDADIAKIPAGVESRFKDLDTDGDGLPDRMEEGLGTDLANSDSDGDGFNDGMEVFNNFSPLGPGVLALDQQLTNRLRGRIVIQAEKQGQAWYINPVDGKRYYMKNGEAAYQIMRFLSLGITNHDIDAIGVGEVTGVYQP